MKHHDYYPPQYNKWDSFWDCAYWLFAVLIIFTCAIFPEQVVDFWHWVLNQPLFML